MRLIPFRIVIKPPPALAGSLVHVVLLGLLFCAGWCLDAGAQTNSWIGSSSGYWENPDWSLGLLPGTNQFVLFTNAGWKALGITANTAQNYPQTLSVDSITISSPTNSFNTLVLNYAGFVTPLTANSLTVGSNSAVVMDSSALRVAGKLAVGGTFTADNFSQVTTANLDVGHNGPGIFNLNSGTLTSGGGSEYVGSSFPSQFMQQGGTNSARNLMVYADSGYDLNDGEMTTWIFVRAGGSFNLRGGMFLNSSEIGSHIDGRFFQSGGTIVSLSDYGALIFPAEDAPWGTSHQIGAIGTGLQTGGTNHAFALRVGFYNMPSSASYAPIPPGGGSYTLSNGVFVTTETVIAPCGGMQQWGGTHAINGTLSVRGAINYDHGKANQVFSAGYLLGAGTLLPQEISIGAAAGITQSGGTNQVSEALTLSGSEWVERYGGTYQLAGGLLTASNLILNVRSEFSQTGGQLVVRNLQLNNGSFSQSGGELVVSNIQFMGGVFSQSGGAFTHSGVLTLAGGTWSVPGRQTQQLGQLEVAGASTLDLGSGGSGVTTVLRFQDSRDVPWSGATLSIAHWNSTTGLGTDHIFVGASAQGLTADQLSRVTFVRPNGSPPDYSAAIMPTGEVVPGAVHDYDCATTNGTITITHYTGAGGDVTIPGTINNLPVTGIGNAAFSSCPSLTSVTIGNNVSIIGRFAFSGCTNLTCVTMGNSVTTIPDWVFESCTSLSSVTLGGSVTSIGVGAFFRCVSLTSITIPDSVTGLGSGAFSSCTRLTNATIGSSVTNIGTSAFSDCTSLTGITIPNSVTSIGDSAFSSCRSLTNVTIGDSVITIGNSAFSSCTNLTSLTISDNVTSIGSSAFYSCINLTNVTLGNSVTSIGDQAFRYCTSLSAIDVDALNSAYSSVDGVVLDKSTNTLILCPQGKRGSYAVPTGVASIGTYAFVGCTGLTSITIPNSVTTIGDWAFTSCTSLTNVTLGSSVTAVGDSAFSFCAGLTRLTIPDSVTSIGSSAFSDCTSLRNVSLGSGVASIGDWSFNGCTSLASVTIGNNVTSLGYGAFSSCSSLTDVTLGSSVASIGDLAFSGCSSLSSITIPNSVINLGNGAFSGCSSLASVTIGNGVTTIGGQVFSSCTSLASFTIGNSVTTVGDYAFSACSSLANVIIGDSVTTIGSSAFYSCINLTNVTLGNSVTSIGDQAFSSCTSLSSVTIPDSVTTIGSSAFYSCINLTNVTLGNSVTSIGDQAFRNCTSLSAIDVDAFNSAYSSVDGVVLDKSTNTLILCPQGKRGSYAVPSSVTSIGEQAFWYCTGLTSLTIPDSVTSIGRFAFSGCTNLTNVTLGNSVITIGYSAFSDCGSLIGLAIPNSVTSIGERAFWHCTGLTSLTIPDRVTSIGDYAFSSCSSLANVTIGNAVTGIGDAAFYSCTSLTNVTIGNSLTSIGAGVFYGCSSLTSISIGYSVATISGSAFSGCTSLTALAVDPINSFFSSGDGVLFNKSRTLLIQCPGGKAGSYTIPDSVTSISDQAFAYCYGLTNVTIPNSVTSIGYFAFYYCGSLISVTMGNSVTSIGGFVFAYCGSLNAVYFRGAAPSVREVLDYPVNANNATVYYLPGTMGWGPTFAGCPTAPWVLPNPVILDFGPSFGLQTNHFGFIISWATNVPVVVEACTDLANGVWFPLSTNVLLEGWSYFNDPQWASYPSRFYRVRSP